MVRRTTIEIDPELLDRAKRALKLDTAKATVEESLRRVADNAEREKEEARKRLREWAQVMPTLVDLDVMSSDEMWR